MFILDCDKVDQFGPTELFPAESEDWYTDG
jgi:hypothetical protein